MADARPVTTGVSRPQQAGRGSVFESMSMPVYRIVLLGSSLAFISFNAWGPAQGVVAFDLTGNNRAVGLVVFGQGLAMFLLNPFSGAIADRVSKRWLILACQMIAFFTMLTTAFLVVFDLINVPLLALGSFVVGIMFSFNGPARNALLGDLIPEERLGNAIALMQVGANFARTAAPFLAGALLAWEVSGAAGTYFVMAAIMGIVIATYRRLPDTPMRANRNDTTMLQDVGIGLRHVRAEPRLLQAIISFQVVAILGFSYTVLMPGYAKSVMDAGNAGVGILLGSAAAGGVVTSLISASYADSRSAGTLLHGACLMLGLSLIATGLAPSFTVAIITMALVGGGSSAFQTLNNVIALRHSHHDFYGRVMGFMFIAWGLTNLAGLPVGLLADEVGERTVLAGMGVALCIATVLFAVWASRIEARERETAAEGAS